MGWWIDREEAFSLDTTIKSFKKLTGRDPTQATCEAMKRLHECRAGDKNELGAEDAHEYNRILLKGQGK